MLSQCVNFGLNSESFFSHWTVKIPLQKDGEYGIVERPNPATVSHCDWQDVRNMMKWQAFVATIEVENGQPDVYGKKITLSAILLLQHNLVNYLAPSLSGESISQLAIRLDQIESSDEYTTGLKSLGANVAKLPGMHD